MKQATPETIQAAFDEIQRFAPSTPLFRWAEIDDIEPIEIKWPKPIVPDEDLTLYVKDFKTKTK